MPVAPAIPSGTGPDEHHGRVSTDIPIGIPVVVRIPRYSDQHALLDQLVRLNDINMVLSHYPLSDIKERSVLKLMKEISEQKEKLNKSNKELATDRFLRAKRSYNKGDLATAIKMSLDAQYLDPDNLEIEEFIEKAESRALTH